MTRLSICIPTYNYGDYIGETLDSLLPQIPPDVEVIVLDGGSTDGTADVVASRQQVCPQLAYHNQGFRGGIDRDIEKVVSLANGSYCWLLSADDTLFPGAIGKVLAAIESDDDVYLCEHDLCDIGMKPFSEYPIFIRQRSPRRYDLAVESDKKSYFESARTSEAFFSFLSAPIFKKTVWDRADIPESFRGTCWIVAGRLLSMIPKGLTIHYLGETLLHKREGNDSFSNGSVVNRHRITIESFHHVANTVFGESSFESYQIRRVLKLDCPFPSLLYAKLKTAQFPEKEDIHTLDRLVKMNYSDSSMQDRLLYAIYKCTPVIALRIMQALMTCKRNISEKNKKA